MRSRRHDPSDPQQRDRRSRHRARCTRHPVVPTRSIGPRSTVGSSTGAEVSPSVLASSPPQPATTATSAPVTSTTLAASWHRPTPHLRQAGRGPRRLHATDRVPKPARDAARPPIPLSVRANPVACWVSGSPRSTVRAHPSFALQRSGRPIRIARSCDQRSRAGEPVPMTILLRCARVKKLTCDSLLVPAVPWPRPLGAPPRATPTASGERDLSGGDGSASGARPCSACRSTGTRRTSRRTPPGSHRSARAPRRCAPCRRAHRG